VHSASCRQAGLDPLPNSVTLKGGNTRHKGKKLGRQVGQRPSDKKAKRVLAIIAHISFPVDVARSNARPFCASTLTPDECRLVSVVP
jgi:hypothetical protein